MIKAEIVNTIMKLEDELKPFSNDEGLDYAIAYLDRAAVFLRLSDIEIKNTKEIKQNV